jgi:hypothetical protein
MEPLIYLMVEFDPWAFGTSQGWSKSQEPLDRAKTCFRIW